MAGVLIETKIDDLKLEQDLLALIRMAENPYPMFDEIGEMLVSSTQERSEKEEDPEGNTWEKSIRAETEGGQTLRDKGTLMDSITHEATNEGVEWGSGEIYAAVQQLGATIKPVNGEYLIFKVNGQWVMTKEVTIDPRPFLGVSKDDETRIRNIVARHLGVM